MTPTIPQNPLISLRHALNATLDTIDRPGNFAVSGQTELLPPAMDIAGFGPIALPLLPQQATDLIRVADAAPFGRGAQTIIDPAVRRCWQISADRVRLGGRHWPRTMDIILERVREGFGISEPITADLHKLLIYETGSFFTGHRDTEKMDRMFATLVVVLPSTFSGGELIVQHQGWQETIPLQTEDPAEVSFAAFYADCIHEIKPVTAGYRLALTYNLARSGRKKSLKAPDFTDAQNRIADVLGQWSAAAQDPESHAPKKLIHLLDHAYTPAELDFSVLKGADAGTASVLGSAARKAGWEAHLALLTVEESGSAEYTGRWGNRYSTDKDDFEEIEVCSASQTLSNWCPFEGSTPIDIGLPALIDEYCSPDAIENLEPDEEYFREATGNEGASFDRTYRRAALVIWPSDRTLAVLSQANLDGSLSFLGSLIEKLKGAASEHAAALRRDIVTFIGNVIGSWPEYGAKDDAISRMLTHLAAVNDEASIIQFVERLLVKGRHNQTDNIALADALHCLPMEKLARICALIAASNTALSPFACADLLAKVAAPLQAAAVNLEDAALQLLTQLPGDPSRVPPFQRHWGDEAISPQTVVALMAALTPISPELADRAVTDLLHWRRTYDLDPILVPAARTLAAQKDFAGTSAFERLKAACLDHLRARAAEPLAPPPDAQREHVLPCQCAHCAGLSRFLADPEQKIWTCKAAERERGHMERTIAQAKADLDTKIDKSGRPYTLVCTKNQASYKRRTAQRAEDLDNIKRLTER